MVRKLIARFAVERMMGRAQRVFFVYGMRRSGNHACVGWLANALEGKSVNLIQSPQVSNFNYSDTGQTFFVNDVSTMASRRYLKTLYRDLGKIRRARFIVVSAEDQDAAYADNWRIPARSELILVRRNTLNLMASRFQNLNRRAREGHGASMQSMKARFFATLRANLECPRGAVWEFDRWHDDEAWRHRFLTELGLTYDIAPAMVGLGSSFSWNRTLPASEKMNQRFMMVEPWDAWVSFIKESASKFPEVFSAAELASIQALADR